MKIIPAIDLIEGRCVRLSQGDFNQKTEYSDSPLEIAKQFQDHGITWLHMVDLDGARSGEPKNMKVLEEVASGTTLRIDFSGGIRTHDHVKAAFQSGAHSIAVGSAAVRAPEEVKGWIKSFGEEYFILGADVKGGKLAISGWQEATEVLVADFIRDWIDVGISRFLCTSIEQDGLLQGPDFELYKEILKQFPDIELIASGGVSSVDDLKQLQEMGLPSAILGKAFYEGLITLADLQKF